MYTLAEVAYLTLTYATSITLFKNKTVVIFVLLSYHEIICISVKQNKCKSNNLSF